MELKNRISTKELLEKEAGTEVVLGGWLQDIRDLGKISFIILRDREGLAQVVVADDLETIRKIPRESVLAIKGVVQDSKSRDFPKELKLKEYEILSESDPQLPIEFLNEEIETTLDKRLDFRWLDIRNPKRLLIFKITDAFYRHAREFLRQEKFLEVHTPKFMGSPSESGAEVFEVPYFKRKAYLAQSPQFYKQMAVIAGLEKVFEVGPVFRAEPSHTTRHQTEFTGLDVEFAWIDGLEDVMTFQERMFAFVFEKLKEEFNEDVKEAFGTEINVPEMPFPRITMDEAKKIVKERGGPDLPPDEDLDSGGEKILGEYMTEKYNHDFVFLTEFPIAVRPFYHMVPEDNPNTTKSYDLLFKGLEITTGAQREHRYDVLVKQAKDKGMNIDNLEFYLNFFRWGAAPHGGFGLGPSRVVMRLLGLNNIREAVLISRDTERVTP